uniref:PEST proteolytic signal-containing nuclear protein n=1 Tax=Globodera pallida TaxID=36090 RepID=A0A183C7Y9_GLOPA
MSASSSRSNDEPKSSHKGADRKQFIVSSGTSVEAANRSVGLSETEVQLEKLTLDTQRDQKKKSDACANGGEEIKKFFKLAERGGAAGMRAMLKGPNNNNNSGTNNMDFDPFEVLELNCTPSLLSSRGIHCFPCCCFR